MKELYSAFNLVVICILALHVTQTKQSSDDDRKKSVEKSKEILTDLYHVMRSIAFPKSPYSNSATAHNRFILMSPGKVLNYDDYYPGDEYTASLKKKNMSAPYTLVPPSVMEKWFDIADVVVGGDVNSGDTGKSLALIYESIISQITVKDFNLLYENAEARYNEAKAFLTEQIQDPVNVTQKTTRMNLYSVYEEEYADRRLEMEQKINKARQTKSSLEYQLWFQRHYQTLNAKVEDAYSKWLVFGQKTLVELYTTFMDVSSATNALEETRIALRGSAVTSLDRTRTMYPVSFEPSNWYEYLLTKDPLVSRDMLVMKRSMLQSELDTLNHLSKGGQEKVETLTRAMREKVNNAIVKRKNATIGAIDARTECIEISTMNTANFQTKQNPCKQFKEKVSSAISEGSTQAGVLSEYDSVTFLLKSNEGYQTYMTSKMNALKSEIIELDHQLDNLSDDQVYLGEIPESPEFKAVTKKEQPRDSQWLKFDYNSEVKNEQKKDDSTSVAASAESSIPISDWVVNSEAKLGVEMSEAREAMDSANLRATGELLRVFIKRPWFKPSLFENPMLDFVQRDSESGKTAYVSPPPATDRELASIINGKHHNIYLMPEYVTSFLMARNVRLEYTGLDSSSTSKSMEVMLDFKSGGGPGYGLMGNMFGGGFGVKVGKKSLNAHRTASGMVIEIPGAQIIGYYTQVMPQFPKEQN